MIIEKFGDNQYKYYVSNASKSTDIKQIVLWIHERWKIEQGYQQLKEELGLDHFEGRSWLGLHHHLVLCFMALGFLTLLKYRARGKKISITLPQVRRLLNNLFLITICPHCKTVHDSSDKLFF